MHLFAVKNRHVYTCVFTYVCTYVESLGYYLHVCFYDYVCVCVHVVLHMRMLLCTEPQFMCILMLRIMTICHNTLKLQASKGIKSL